MILGVTARHLYRLRFRYEELGIPGLRDRRTGRRMPQRIPTEVIEEVCRLKQERYPDFSIRHFHEFATENLPGLIKLLDDGATFYREVRIQLFLV